MIDVNQIPTADQVSNACGTNYKSQAPQVGETWKARCGRVCTIMKRDKPGDFLAAILVQFEGFPMRTYLCLDGREAIASWGSPLDLVEKIEDQTDD